MRFAFAAGLLLLLPWPTRRTRLLRRLAIPAFKEAEKPELAEHLVELGRTLSDKQKEDISVMALKVIAAAEKDYDNHFGHLHTQAKAKE